MKITYYGHSCFGITTESHHLLFDPFISYNELASDINIDTIPCDFLLLSHAHQDHIADAEAIAKRTGALLIANYEVATWFGNKGIENTLPMNQGGAKQLDFGGIKVVNAIHSSSFPDGSYGGNPVGFVLTIDGKTIYYAGDTALTLDMKLIGDYHQPDIAFLPIGDHFTMGVEDAVRAAEFIACDHIIGMHYDTFPPITIDAEQAKQAFAAAGKKIELIQIGADISI